MNKIYTVKGKDNFVFRTKFNLSKFKGGFIEFSEDANGQVLIILDRGRMRSQGGHPITVTLREDVRDAEPYTMEVYCGEDWFNPAINEYYNWYYKVRPFMLTIEDENNFRISFCDVDGSDVKTADLLVNIGPIHPDDEKTEKEQEADDELNSLEEGEILRSFNEQLELEKASM